MLLRASFRSLARCALAASAALSLLFAVTHCDSDENIPVDTPFGNGASSSGGARDAIANTSGGSGTSGINDDPNFDPTADGGYWSGYDAGDAGYLADGAPNGGPDVYKDYGHCPLVKPGAFQLDDNRSEATTYGADFTPEVPGTVNRLNLLLASSVPFSYLGPFFPLGFWEPPLPPGTPKVDTFPFFRCKRCVFAATGDENKIFMAIGGMLVMSPAPDPRSGKTFARIDLAVLVEAQKAGSFYAPIPGGRCLRVLTAPINVR